MQLKENNVVFIIPAYKPKSDLLNLANHIDDCNTKTVVVDDGSGTNFDSIFTNLEKRKNFIILRHYFNKGKGAALKTAFEFILLNMTWCEHVITLDADGQHLIADVIKIADELSKHPNCLILGSRQFEGDVPLRSKFGNYLTKFVFKLLVGFYLCDTQTGLRGIPVFLLPHLLKIKENRYEFELSMLIIAKEIQVKFIEVKIETIYENNNASSHFNPILDSMRIYFTFIRYISSSLICALIDFLVFYLVFLLSKNVSISIVSSRLLAGTSQFLFSKKFVFKNKRKNFLYLLKYISLLIFNTMLVHFFITYNYQYLNINVMVSKILIESFLFFFNFYFLRVFVFTQNKKSPADLTNKLL